MSIPYFAIPTYVKPSKAKAIIDNRNESEFEPFYISIAKRFFKIECHPLYYIHNIATKYFIHSHIHYLWLHGYYRYLDIQAIDYEYTQALSRHNDAIYLQLRKTIALEQYIYAKVFRKYYLHFLNKI